MSVTISAQFDCTQREFIAEIAWGIYKKLGHVAPLPADDLMYFFNSKHGMEQAVLWAAEDIFESLTGDSPSYDDDDS